ncbi:MAG: hypothetical protein WCI05_09630 [Myxococcales bacterium]
MKEDRTPRISPLERTTRLPSNVQPVPLTLRANEPALEGPPASPAYASAAPPAFVGLESTQKLPAPPQADDVAHKKALNDLLEAGAEMQQEIEGLREALGLLGSTLSRLP